MGNQRSRATAVSPPKTLVLVGNPALLLRLLPDFRFNGKLGLIRQIRTNAFADPGEALARGMVLRRGGALQQLETNGTIIVTLVDLKKGVC